MRVGVILAAALAACATPAPQTDGALSAVQQAQLRECPADQVQADAHNDGFGATHGAVFEEIVGAPLASDPARKVRFLRVTLAPGAIVAWHSHSGIQGVGLVLAGAPTELRNSCRDPITYQPGDAFRETADTAHSWRNNGPAPAIILEAHAAPRD